MGGLLPRVSNEEDGLMRAGYFKFSSQRINLSPYKLYRIFTYMYNYQREVASLIIGSQGTPFNYIIAYYARPEGATIKIEYGTNGKAGIVKFYKKNNDIFVFFILAAGSPEVCFIQSTSGIELVSEGNPTLDDSYTEITPT